MSGLKFLPFPILLLLLLVNCKTVDNDSEEGILRLLTFKADNETLSPDGENAVTLNAEYSARFSSPVDTASVANSFKFVDSETEEEIALNISFASGNSVVDIRVTGSIRINTVYTFEITDKLSSAEEDTFPGISFTLRTENGELRLLSATANDVPLSRNSITRNIPYNSLNIELTFSDPINENTILNNLSLRPAINAIGYTLSNEGRTVSITNTQPLDYYSFYTLRVNDGLQSTNGATFNGYESILQTGLDSTFKFPEISDEDLLTKVQEYTFKYFWDFAHPVSGLARERNTSGDVVTIGGSGFGLQAIIVGIERSFISRTEGVNRFSTIVDFLINADRFHGAWPHWMNGNTGDVIPFGERDNGADIVETAFMAQGLMTVREYLDENNAQENAIIIKINTLLNEIEWNWFTQGGQNVIYWHWSPNFGWDMNLRVQGYNEALIVYLLAASSSNYAIDEEVYTNGWTRNGAMQNGRSFYGIELPLGYDFGGPLFFAHYSFMGLDPRNLSDSYTDYWTQNRNHSLINRAHSIENPRRFVGYSSYSWGITASDEPGGYSAHDPLNDNGTITPTAALSSMPYTPNESMEALRHFYYHLGDKLWGPYGFYDAFNPTENWWADSYLAIDQGPIIVMIENHRTGLLWDLFMQAPEIYTGLEALGFTINN